MAPTVDSGELHAAMVTSPGRVEIVAQPMPEVHPRDMLIEVSLCGVCGTDVHLVYDTAPLPNITYPFSLGHEPIGRIAALGAEFPRADMLGQPLAAGDRIVVHPSIWACGKCYACRVLLAPNICMRPAFPRDIPRSGAFATHYYVPEGSCVFRVPEDVPDEIAVLTEPIAGALRAIERAQEAGFRAGQVLVVQGAGAIGAALCALGRILGAAEVIAVGAPDNRLELCRRMGATQTISIERTTVEDRREAVLACTPHRWGADAVIEAAGVPTALAEAVDMARPGGAVVEFGHYTHRGSVTLDPAVICRKDLHILGARGHNPQHFGRVLHLMRAYRHLFPFDAVVSGYWSLANLAAALEETRKGTCTKAMIRL